MTLKEWRERLDKGTSGVTVYDILEDWEQDVRTMHADRENLRVQKDATATALAECKVERMRDVIRFHAYLYYHLDRPEISDSQYDTLWRGLEKMSLVRPSSTILPRYITAIRSLI